MKYIIILLLISASSIISCLITQRTYNQEVIELNVLESRVFFLYGEGDTGYEMLHYLKTGENKDIMEILGQKPVCNYDYHVDMDSFGICLYDKRGLFVDYSPTVNLQELWELVDNDNL